MPERKRFLLRLDPAVYDAVERWAGDDLRSVNAQIEHLLLESLRKAGRKPRRRPASPPPGGAPEGGSEDGGDTAAGEE